MRLRPASSAAAEKLVNDRSTPGRTSELTEKLSRSLWKKLASTSAPAALTTACAPGYEGSSAVGTSGVQVASEARPARASAPDSPGSCPVAVSAAICAAAPFPSVWIAVTGRQRLYVYLAS